MGWVARPDQSDSWSFPSPEAEYGENRGKEGIDWTGPIRNCNSWAGREGQDGAAPVLRKAPATLGIGEQNGARTPCGTSARFPPFPPGDGGREDPDSQISRNSPSREAGKPLGHLLTKCRSAGPGLSDLCL